MSSLLKTLFILILIIAALAGGVFLSLMLEPKQSDESLARTIPGLMWPNPKTLTPFTLTDQHNQAFTLDSLKSNWSLLFFGYTRCPDICPATMAMMNGMVKSLDEADKPAPQIVFISVDPERDTPTVLKDYMAYFNPEFIGLGGETDQTNGLLKQLGILSMKINEQDNGEYLMDHTASIILINPKGELLSIYSPPHDPAQIREHYLAVRRFLEERE